MYIRCKYGTFGREITKYTAYIYGSGQPCLDGNTPWVENEYGCKARRKHRFWLPSPAKYAFRPFFNGVTKAQFTNCDTIISVQSPVLSRHTFQPFMFRARDDPSRARDDPSRARDNPSRAHDNPSRARDNPSRARGNPSRARDNPSRARDNTSRARDETYNPLNTGIKKTS